MSTTFRCLDCGYEIVRLGADQPPDPARCRLCQWIADVPDLTQREALRTALDVRHSPANRELPTDLSTKAPTAGLYGTVHRVRLSDPGVLP